MGQRAVLGLVVTVGALLAVAPASASARSLVVGDGGAGCRDARYATIQAAVDAARPGDLVPVCPGTYRESVYVDTPRLKIFSRKRHAAVVQLPEASVPDPPYEQIGFVLAGGGSLVRGFTVLSSGGPCLRSGRALEAFGSGTFDYNRIKSVGCRPFSNGILSLSPGQRGTFNVGHNEISGVEGFAVSVRGGRSAINHNAISGGSVGVGIHGGSSVVQANTIVDVEGAGIRGDGFGLGSGFNLWVAGNRLLRNGRGIVAENFGVGSPAGVKLALRIQSNTVLDSVGDGIMVWSAPGLVTRNRSLGNGGFDCIQRLASATWKDNIGVKDSPSNLCRAP